ncbi:MAG: hypothetical protein HZA61_08985 [Candidatus Eisenbacteria bacterium]|uniref:Uncharacterized protein n=1 Tax=Eiseniibacteriota bacterium TaxID=2212470 RepID=A0A933SD72_UNCEI|nr:hypothetical protein [Candidatus Eisenbacteria bacterium]
MKRLSFVLLLAAMLAGATTAGAEVRAWSELALPVVDAAPARGSELLAQRVIDREWGLSEDSVYTEVTVPGWKSEGVAMALSAGLPGAGQLYVGEGSGWAFLLAEALGWAGRAFTKSEARQAAHDATAFIGNPYDTTAGWSFERWERATGGNSSTLEQYWAYDREAFYQALRNDPVYLAGFDGQQPEETFRSYRDLRNTRDTNLRRAHLAEGLLWVNHVAAAIDAVRAARLHNLPLRQEYQLQLGQRMREGQREFHAALVRRF